MFQNEYAKSKYEHVEGIFKSMTETDTINNRYILVAVREPKDINSNKKFI